MRKVIGTVLLMVSVCMLCACGDGKKNVDKGTELQTDENGNIINVELETDANGDIILDNDKNHTVNEALAGESYTVKNVALWDAWTPSYEIKDGEVLQFDVDLTGGPTVYHSLNAAFCSIATDGTTFPADMAGYKEYLVLRSDVYGWGDDYAGATYIGEDYVYQGETYDYNALWNNADYDIYISRNGNTVEYRYVIRGGDGATYKCGWEIKLSDVSKGCYVYFTGDAGVSFTLKANVAPAYKAASSGSSSGGSSGGNTGTVADNSTLINNVKKHTNTYTVSNKVWWDDWTPSFTLNDGDTLEFEVALNGGNTGYHSLNAVFCTSPLYGDNIPAYSEKNCEYMEYVVLRSDNAGWGYQWDNATYTGSDYISQGNYDYKTLWTNAHYDISISRDGNVITYEYTITGGDGKVYDCGYKVESSFDLRVGCYVFFTGDAGVTFTLGTEEKESVSVFEELDLEAEPLPEGKKYVVSERKEYTYDENIKNYVLHSFNTFEYDDNGNVVEEVDYATVLCHWGENPVFLMTNHINKYEYDYKTDVIISKEKTIRGDETEEDEEKFAICEYNTDMQLLYKEDSGLKFWYEYDAAGRISRFASNSEYERNVSYTYDNTGYIRTNTYDDGTVSYTFMDDVWALTITNITDTYTVNSMGKVTSVQDSYGNTRQTVEYDSAGNIIMWENGTYKYEYKYDARGNLTEWKQYCKNEWIGTEEYTYDSANNLVKKVVRGTSSTSEGIVEKCDIYLYTYKLVNDK